MPALICEPLGCELGVRMEGLLVVDDDDTVRFRLKVSFCGRTVMIRLWLLATIMSVT